MREAFTGALSGATNVMSFENLPTHTLAARIDDAVDALRPQAPAVRACKNRIETSTCQERPRHCNLQYRWPEARLVVGETLTGGPARLSQHEREALAAYAARAS